MSRWIVVVDIDDDFDGCFGRDIGDAPAVGVPVMIRAGEHKFHVDLVGMERQEPIGDRAGTGAV